MPSKGIPFKIFSMGPYEPPTFKDQAKIMPNGTEFVFFNYTDADSAVERISKKLEMLGLTGTY